MTCKAFVSSTFKDLAKHRAYVIDALRKAGFFVDPMEDWVASNDEPKIFSTDRIEGCDLCVLLVGFRRGFIPDSENQSITQLEYEAAKLKGLDILVFILDEDAPWPRNYDDFDRDPEVKKWRQHLQKEHGIGFFGLESSSIQIAPALTRWLAERNNQGAIHDYEYILSLQPELMDLKQACHKADTGKILNVLREKIIVRLKAIAFKNGDESEGKPPIELLRELTESKVVNFEVQKSLEYALGVTSEILYDKKVKIEETIKAIQETAIGFNLLNASFLELPHFKVATNPNGEMSFVFLMDDKIVIEGDKYLSHSSVLNGIRSARRIVENVREIKERETRNGMFLFSLMGPNGQLIGQSVLFKNNADMGLVIKSIKKHLPSAPIIEVPTQKNL